MEFVNIPVNMQLEVHLTTQGTTAKITPATLTPTGMQVLRNKNDLWTFSNQGYLVRAHRTQRKAFFVPDQFNQKVWRTSEEQLSEEAMATQRTLKTHTKHSTPSSKRESLEENLGQEKRGSERNTSPRQHTTNATIAGNQDDSSNISQPSTSTSNRTPNRKDETHNTAATV